jgi:hypothetical protein
LNFKDNVKLQDYEINLMDDSDEFNSTLAIDIPNMGLEQNNTSVTFQNNMFSEKSD